MDRRNALWRLGGLVSIAASAATSLLHRDVLAAHAAGRPSALEFVLGLASFALASLGVLLVIYGARLRDDGRRAIDREDARRSAPAGDQPPGPWHQPAAHQCGPDPLALPGSRIAMLALLTDRCWTPPPAQPPSNPPERTDPRDRTRPAFRDSDLSPARRGRDRRGL